MVTIFLDECGFTGQDLFNREQPYLAIATLNLSEDKCSKLKDAFFRGVQGKELKHKSLAKRPTQQRVINFLKHLKSNDYDVARIGYVDKKFALVCSMFDLLLEPYGHEDGLDFYERGFNIAFSNMFYLAVPALGGEQLFRNLLCSYQRMVRERSIDAYSQFYSLIFTPYPKELDSLIGWFRISHWRKPYSFLTKLPDHPLDIGFSMTLKLMSDWRARLGNEPIVLIHDRSSQMSKQEHYWKALTSPALNEAIIGWDRRTIKFPIGVERTEFESSEKWAGLQLTDVLAGAAVRHAAWLNGGQSKGDSYGAELTSVFSDWAIFHTLMPEEKFTPEELGTVGPKGQDPFEYLGQAMRKTNKV